MSTIRSPFFCNVSRYFCNNIYLIFLVSGLALTNLITTQNTTVLQRFGLIMLNILESLNDITKTEDDGPMTDSLVLVEGQSPSRFDEDGDGYYETDHDQRKKQLILSDPVHTVVLKDYFQSQVGFCLLKKVYQK